MHVYKKNIFGRNVQEKELKVPKFSLTNWLNPLLCSISQLGACLHKDPYPPDKQYKYENRYDCLKSKFTGKKLAVSC